MLKPADGLAAPEDIALDIAVSRRVLPERRATHQFTSDAGPRDGAKGPCLLCSYSEADHLALTDPPLMRRSIVRKLGGRRPS